MQNKRMEVLREYARSNMSASKTAKALYMGKSTVNYHLDRVYEETGLNPRNFYDLVILVGADSPITCSECKHRKKCFRTLCWENEGWQSITSCSRGRRNE